MPADSDSSVESGSSDSMDSDEEAEVCQAPAEASESLPRQGWKPGMDMYRHKRTKTLHFAARRGRKELFSCGRKITADFEKCQSSAFVDLRRCKQCDLAKPLRDEESLAAALEEVHAARSRAGV